MLVVLSVAHTCTCILCRWSWRCTANSPLMTQAGRYLCWYLCMCSLLWPTRFVHVHCTCITFMCTLHVQVFAVNCCVTCHQLYASLLQYELSEDAYCDAHLFQNLCGTRLQSSTVLLHTVPLSAIVAGCLAPRHRCTTMDQVT